MSTGKERRGPRIPHLAKNERDAPNFLYAALERTACAPFFKERRIKCAEPTELHRKSGMWGTHWPAAGTDPHDLWQAKPGLRSWGTLRTDQRTN